MHLSLPVAYDAVGSTDVILQLLIMNHCFLLLPLIVRALCLILAIYVLLSALSLVFAIILMKERERERAVAMI